MYFTEHLCSLALSFPTPVLFLHNFHRGSFGNNSSEPVWNGASNSWKLAWLYTTSIRRQFQHHDSLNHRLRPRMTWPGSFNCICWFLVHCSFVIVTPVSLHFHLHHTFCDDQQLAAVKLCSHLPFDVVKCSRPIEVAWLFQFGQFLRMLLLILENTRSFRLGQVTNMHFVDNCLTRIF